MDIRRIKVLHLTFKVQLVPGHKIPNDMGQCDTVKQLITISDDLSVAHQKDVLLHETLHALFALLGIPGAGFDEETLVVIMTTGLLALLRDNPNLFEYLMEK